MSRAPVLRAGRDDDADAFIALIGACWAEYPGCVMDVDGEVPELRALATYYAGQGGALWAAEAQGRVVGMVGTRPLDAGAWEICKMYAYPDQRGTGLARTLIATAEAFARGQGATAMKLWTDTRFERAHRFYEKCSYVQAGPIRVLDDLSHSLEYAYAKPLTGLAVERLDAAAAASAAPRLSAILQACVDDGASVGFLPPLAPATAAAFWKSAASEVATGQRLLLAGWVDGELVGTIGVALATQEDQPHRATIERLLVQPGFRRRGLARLLLRSAERAARAAHRTLLVLDSRAGDAGAPLYRAEGWTEAGTIPGYALDADGTPRATTVFYKQA